RDQRDLAALRCLRRDMSYRETGAGAGESPVGHERADARQSDGLDEARGHQHLLHAPPPPRTFIANHHDVAGPHHARLDRRRRVVFALEYARPTLEREEGRIHARRLHDATVAREVAVEDGETAIPAVGMRVVADAAVRTIQVERVVARILCER